MRAADGDNVHSRIGEELFHTGAELRTHPACHLFRDRRVNVHDVADFEDVSQPCEGRQMDGLGDGSGAQDADAENGRCCLRVARQVAYLFVIAGA